MKIVACKRLWALKVVFLLILGGGLQARQIIFSSPAFETNLDSFGVALSGEMHFELGAFDQGFSPTSENTGQWLTHWHPLGRADYNATFSAFTGEGELLNNELPFLTGGRAYLWGFDHRLRTQTRDRGQWILVASDDWNWPMIVPSPLLPLEWSTEQVSEAILGSVNTGGDRSRHLESTEVMLEDATITPEDWRDGFFPAGTPEELSAWSADPDSDGVNNLLEFAAGTDPTDPSSFCHLEIRPNASAAGMLDLVICQNPFAGGVRYEVESSTDLRDWSVIEPAPPSSTLNTDLKAYLVWELESSAASKRFFRVSAVLTAPKAQSE